MSDVLKGTSEMSDVIIRDAIVPELYIAPAGAPPDNPGDLLVSQTANEVFDGLKRDFDLIIIDAAPVMAAPETIALATAADEVLLFVKWSSTPRAAALAAHRKLQNVGANLSGIVLTMVDVSRISKYSSIDAVAYSREVRRYYSRGQRS
jgi:Mrp family chromosome partitioning ATPase